MSGFPTYITRDDLGPEYRNLYPPENPETDADAEHLNLLRWQAAGAALVVPRAILIAAWDSGSSAFQVSREDQVWNSRRDQTDPTLARTGAGQYTYTFASAYKDQAGEDVSTTLLGARVSVLDIDAATLWAADTHVQAEARITSGSPLVVEVKLGNFVSGAFSAYADHKFLLEVW